jgi:hypothetical protein
LLNCPQNEASKLFVAFELSAIETVFTDAREEAAGDMRLGAGA